MSDHQNHDAGGPATNLPIEFKFRDHPVRAFGDGPELAVVATDACTALDIRNSRDALSRLEPDEKGVVKVDTLGGPQELAVVYLSGLVRLITRSNKPEARAFQRWLFHDVVPAIYKTGRYEVGQEQTERVPEESHEHARQRFRDIYSGDFISPDYLLKILFVGNIPYTGDKRFPLLAKESCEALGIGNKDAALERLPPLAKGFVTVDLGAGSIEREAITEAALYALAFDRRHLNPPWPVGAGGLFPYDVAAQSDAVALSYQIKTLESYFRAFREKVSLGAGLAETPAFHNFERVISSAAQAADQQLTVCLLRQRH